MSVTRSEFQLIEEATADLRQLMLQYEDHPALQSIERQLQYLVDLQAGRVSEQRLNDIILGRMAAYDVETLDLPLAEKLYRISAIVDRLLQEI